MRRELLIAAAPGEWRAALVEDGAAVELFVLRGEHHEPGGLYLGRVVRLVPGLGAALVEIGDERPAFLPFAETLGAARPQEGARLIVQIRREAQGGKAARVAMRALLHGGHVELRIGRPGISGAEDLSDRDRDRLRHAAGEGGLRILAPAAADALVAEAAALAGRWRALAAQAAALDPPARLDPAPSRAAALAARLPVAPPHVAADDPAALPQLRAAFPDAEVAPAAARDWPIDLDAAFDEALAPSLALPGGGAVHFEPTRAGLMVDVDSGDREAGSPEAGAVATDLAAAAAIARQLRLRRIGGGIVVDFVGLDRRDQKERVRAALAAALAGDPAQPQILGWTRLGHLELVRPRRGRPLAEIMLAPATGGAAGESPATLAYEALRAVARAARAEPARSWRIAAAPAVAAALAGIAAEALRALETRLGRDIAIAADPACERFQIAPV